MWQYYIADSVVVRNGAVTEINIERENETPQFFMRAKEIINTIIHSQSLEVDGVTDATFSSKGIQNAVYNALKHAVTDGELKITEIQVSPGAHGHRRPFNQTRRTPMEPKFRRRSVLLRQDLRLFVKISDKGIPVCRSDALNNGLQILFVCLINQALRLCAVVRVHIRL